RFDFALKVRIGLRLFFNRGVEKFENMFGRLRRYRPPLEREATFSGEHVLRRATMNQSDVKRRVRWIKGSVLLLLELFGDRFETIDQSCCTKHSRRAERRISAVCFAAFDDHFCE